jgi:hypothetical protein
MDIAFVGEKDQFVVIYLDDITILSRFDIEHFFHLRKVFLKMSEVWPFLKSQEIFVCYEGGEVVRPYSINIGSED